MYYGRKAPKGKRNMVRQGTGHISPLEFARSINPLYDREKSYEKFTGHKFPRDRKLSRKDVKKILRHS